MKDKKYFEDYIKIFLTQNSILNLVSKNDEKYLWEKHIFDSLSFDKFYEKYTPKAKNLLDIGCGGGFPSVPIAICYPKLEVFALDSIRKKITAIENIKSALDIKNLHTICDRAENITNKYDLITSRAVAKMSIILKYALPLLNENGYFIAYKSIKVTEEINEAKDILKKYNAEVVDILSYELPIEGNFTRNLVVVKYR